MPEKITIHEDGVMREVADDEYRVMMLPINERKKVNGRWVECNRKEKEEAEDKDAGAKADIKSFSAEILVVYELVKNELNEIRRHVGLTELDDHSLQNKIKETIKTTRKRSK